MCFWVERTARRRAGARARCEGHANDPLGNLSDVLDWQQSRARANSATNNVTWHTVRAAKTVEITDRCALLSNMEVHLSFFKRRVDHKLESADDGATPTNLQGALAQRSFDRHISQSHCR